MAFMYVTSGPKKGDCVLREMQRGETCIQAEQSKMFLHYHAEGKTSILKMAIVPKGWITVAMRGAENFGFLEKDDDVAREDRTDEGQGLQWPAQTLHLIGRLEGAAPLVPSSASACAAGAQSICWLIGHALCRNSGWVVMGIAVFARCPSLFIAQDATIALPSAAMIACLHIHAGS
jgi:hypothetical protein